MDGTVFICENIIRMFVRKKLRDRKRRILCARVRRACARMARGLGEFYPTVRENVSDFYSFVPCRSALSLCLSVCVCVCLPAIPVSFSY